MVLDLAAALLLNYGVSSKAAAAPTLRWQPFGGGDSFYTDGRFIGTLVAAGVEHFGSGMVSRAAEVAANGFAGSLMTGEVYRAQAMKNAAAAAAVVAPPPQIQGGQNRWYPPPNGAPQQVGYGFDYAPAF